MNSRARTRKALRSLILEGEARNGISPDECGEWSALVQGVYEAWELAGTAGARRFYDAQVRANPAFAQLIAADDPLAGFHFFTAADLLREDIPEPEYLVDSVLPEGVSLLASPPKIGKTLLALNIAVALSTGGRALGSIPVRQGRVLFLALEGSKRGLKRRIEAMLSMGEKRPELLHICREFPKMDDGGADLIGQYLQLYRDTRLVIIDTLKRVRGRGDARRNLYDEDYDALQPINELREETGVSFLVIHHTNKREAGDDVLDLVSGSTGLTGAVDNVLVLQKQRGQADAKLTIIPREEEEAEYALRFDAAIATWILEGPADEIAKTAERQQIMSVLRSAESALSTGEIAAAVGKKTNNVSILLKRMEAEGKVLKAQKYGSWALPSTNR